MVIYDKEEFGQYVNEPREPYNNKCITTNLPQEETYDKEYAIQKGLFQSGRKVNSVKLRK